MSLAFVFPGQGSQSVGMLSSITDDDTYGDIVKQTFAQASEQLGFDLWQLTEQGPAELLNQTENTQPAMLTAGVALWRIWQQMVPDSVPELMAGHSLGEYTALVCAGAMDFSDAVRLVHARGKYMQQAVAEGEGAMAAILGLDDDQVNQCCEQAEKESGKLVAAVNYNSPGQVVIAGYTASVELAMQMAKEAGARRALKLPVSVPSHCSLMQPAADQLAADFEKVSIHKAQIPVINNVDVAIEQDGGAIARALLRQLTHPVRWVETIEKMAAQGIDRIVECGPGKVLTGLNKRISKEIQTYPVFDLATLNKTTEELLNGK